MAHIPEPTPGLIFRYGYLWLEEYRKGRTDPSKDRPACIIARMAQHADHSLKIVDDVAVEPGDVIILPITTKPPGTGQISVELTADEKRLCRLNPDFPSWLIVSEFNADMPIPIIGHCCHPDRDWQDELGDSIDFVGNYKISSFPPAPTLVAGIFIPRERRKSAAVAGNQMYPYGNIENIP